MASAVEEYVESPRFAHHCGNGFKVEHIQLACDAALKRRNGIAVAIGRPDGRPFGGEPDCRRSTDALAGASDQRCLAGKPSAHRAIASTFAAGTGARGSIKS